MAKPNHILLPGNDPIPILYEDRSVIAIDKPAGWMLVPFTWQRTDRNLQTAIVSSIAAGHFWARCRNLTFLRNIHRLDAGTTGVLLFGRSLGAVNSYGELFEGRRMEKVYLAVTDRPPEKESWSIRAALGPDPQEHGRMRVDSEGKPAETEFRLIASREGRYLVEARPLTGRTHQIRVHMVESGCPILGDELYGDDGPALGLRAIGLAYRDPFTRKEIGIRAPIAPFLHQFGFDGVEYRLAFNSISSRPPAKPAPDAAPKTPPKSDSPAQSRLGKGGGDLHSRPRPR
jgi:23S rRNA pseudouridine1911/1915/1917 synthase